MHGYLVYMYTCISMLDYIGRSGGILPQEILEIRYSEIASEAILEQKQSHSGYTARRALHPIFGWPLCIC